jgi:hypothetical protein
MNTGLGQRLDAQAIAGAVLLILASALIWVGVAFAGYALYLASLTRTAAPWAAAIAAAILVIGPIGWAVIMNFRAPRASRAQFCAPDTHVAPAETQDAMLGLLARVAQEKPLLAVVCAGILGASEAILHRKD